jgi:hypothetical protein
MKNISTILSNPTINQLSKQWKEVDREGKEGRIGTTNNIEGRELMFQKVGINAPEGRELMSQKPIHHSRK